MKITRPLFIMGLPFVIATIISHFLSKYVIIIVIITLCIITMTVLVFLKKKKRVFFCLILFSSLVAFASFLYQNHFGYEKLTSYAQKDALFEGKIVDIKQNEKGTFCYTVKVSDINNEALLNKSSKMNIYSVTPIEITIDDKIKFTAQGDEITSTSEFDTKEWYKQKSIYLSAFNVKNVSIIKDKTFSVRRWAFETGNYFSNVIDEKLSGETANLIKTIVLGEKVSTSNVIERNFNRAGILHITAISGLHISIISLFLCKIFGRKKFALILPIVLIWVFVAITNFRISAVRCAIMQTILLLGNVSGRPADSLNSLFFSAILILLQNPFAIFDLAFSLSFLSVIGIIVSQKKIQNFFMVILKLHNKISVFLASSVACTLAVTIFTLPISIIVLNGISFAGFFANILVVPLTSVVFLSGLFLCLLGGISIIPFVNFLLIKVVETSIHLVCVIANFFAGTNLFVGTNYDVFKYATLSVMLVIIGAVFLYKIFSKEMIIKSTCCIVSLVLTCSILFNPVIFASRTQFKLITSYDSSAVIFLHFGKTSVITINSDGLILNDVLRYLDGKNVKSIENYIEITPKIDNYEQFAYFSGIKRVKSVWVDEKSTLNEYCSDYNKNIDIKASPTIEYIANDFKIIKNDDNIFINNHKKTMLITSSQSTAEVSNCEFLIYSEEILAENVKFPAEYVILLCESNSLENEKIISIINKL